jgi:hypothetical protein
MVRHSRWIPTRVRPAARRYELCKLIEHEVSMTDRSARRVDGTEETIAPCTPG